MRVKNFNYSLKNIPIPSEDTYLKRLTSATESFIRRLRWKAYFFDSDGSQEDPVPAESFGFRSNKTPPYNNHLALFEKDMYELIRTVEFRKVNNQFLRRLRSDVREIKSSSDLLVPADKTTNLYEMTKTDYNKLLNENITKSYNKGDENVYRVNHEAKEIAKKIGITDKVECFVERDAFITLKDHKDNFQNNPKCRLINPSKSRCSNGLSSCHTKNDLNS